MLDIKDKKLLYELSENSRLSAPQIAARIGLSKDAVIYRIKNLKSTQIIKKFITVVNLKKLGYRTHIIFLEFRKFDIKTEKEIISFLVNFPYTIWVSSSSGKWDMIIDIISRDADQLDRILTDIFNKLGDNLKEYEVLETIKEYYYNHKYLTEKSLKNIPAKPVSYTPDKTDFLILKELSQDSRIKSIEIAKRLEVSHDKISYRIKKLLKSGYIEQFTVLPDFSNMKRAYYYIFLQFSSLADKRETRIISFLKSQKEVLFFGKNAGKYNFNVDIIVKDPNELKKFLVKLREHFGDILGSRETLLMFEQHKNDYFPEGILIDKGFNSNQ